MSEEPNNTRFLTFEDRAAQLPFSKSTLRRWIRDGSIPSYQPRGRGSRRAFHPDVLNIAVAPAAGSEVRANLPRGGPDTKPAIAAAPKLPGPKPKWLSRITNQNSSGRNKE